MKRFLAFHGDEYYPCGGWGDFLGDFDSEDLAVAAIHEAAVKNKVNSSPDELWRFQWAHVVDTETQREVWSA